MQNTHAGKAQSYDLGRPAYPAAFYDWFYDMFCREAVIADIGTGTGKVTQGFLERGSRVFAVEPDEDMRRILRTKLNGYANCTVLETCAEETGIPTGAVDLIFCGNSYHWFDRTQAVPEFKRILRESGRVNVVLANLGHGAGSPPPFRDGAFEAKELEFTIYQDWDTFLNGMLSTSFSPNPGDDCYVDYEQILRRFFDNHSRNELLKSEFRLCCTIGNVNDLI